MQERTSAPMQRCICAFLHSCVEGAEERGSDQDQTSFSRRRWAYCGSSMFRSVKGIRLRNLIGLPFLVAGWNCQLFAVKTHQRSR